MTDIADPSVGSVARLASLKHAQEPDVHPGADVHGDLKVKADLVHFLLGTLGHVRQGQL